MPKTLKPINTKELEGLLESGNFTGARKILNSFMSQDLSADEKGKIYTEIVSMYLQLTNKVNQTYLQQLKETNEALRRLNAEEKKSDDEIRKMEIEESLKHPEHDEDDL